ncbi:hypothetical protein M8J77_023518 [Diaphorina citri]|nr:hypothetical protein M8J77_023518 [Diaphorina citri]
MLNLKQSFFVSPRPWGEYNWVSDGPLYDSGFIGNDGLLKKNLHPPQLSLEVLSLPIGFPESIQGPLVILSTSAMMDLDSTSQHFSEYNWVSDGPLYDSGFIDNDGLLKKNLHPPQLSLEVLSLPIGFPESIQGPLVILSTSAMMDLSI